MNIGVLVLLGAVMLFAAYRIASRPSAVETFEWTAPKGTYVFGSVTPQGASDLDKALGRLVDAVIPKDVIDGGGAPQPEPFDDSEAEGIAVDALARVKGRALDFVNVEYVGKAVDMNDNKYYDIAFMAYDKERAMMAKLALTALVTKSGKVFVRRFSSFDQTPPATGIEGTAEFSAEHAAYEEELGIDYAKIYS